MGTYIKWALETIIGVSRYLIVISLIGLIGVLLFTYNVSTKLKRSHPDTTLITRAEIISPY